MSSEADISIVGPGKVGTALAMLGARAGLRVLVAGRGAEAARQAARQAGGQARAVSMTEAAAGSPVVLLTVSDSAIGAVCAQLADAFDPAAVVAHCSGAIDSEPLAPAGRRGCAVGSIHPLQTFPDPAVAAGSFAGTYCFVEGGPRAAEVLSDLARRLGGVAETLGPGGKVPYHAAAVMACNYLVALLDAATVLAVEGGVREDVALPALGRIVRATVENVLAAGPAAALTGPIARGDAATVALHVAALREAPPALRDLYRAAGLWTVDLARRKGTVDDAAARACAEALTEKTPAEKTRSRKRREETEETEETE